MNHWPQFGYLYNRYDERIAALRTILKLKHSERAGKDRDALRSDANDRQLLGAVALGDRKAIAELYEIYFPRLFKFLHRLSRDYCLVEETINDVMLIVWRTADQFRGSSRVSTWILGIGYRQCLKKLRKRRIPQLDTQIRKEVASEPRDTVELNDLISNALLELTPEHRIMIESVLYLGMTYEEVAVLAGCPVNTAKTRVHNARKKLRRILVKHGYRHGEHIG